MSLPGLQGQGKACQPPHPLLIHSRGHLPPLASLLGPNDLGTPHSLPQPEGDSPKVWGEGTPVFCFSSGFLSRENGTIAQAPAPHPPHSFLRFLLPLSRLPAPAPVSAPSPAQLPLERKELGVGGLWERKEPGITPPLPPVALLPRVWVVMKGRQGALSFPEYGLPPQGPQS